MRYLGLDLGSKTLGIATSDLTNILATTLTTLNFKDEDYDELINQLLPIIKENNITKRPSRNARSFFIVRFK